MAWIESHQSLGRHPKTKAAARELQISRVQLVGHLHFLWWWALDFAEDGDLSGIAAEDIAEEAMWEGDPDRFLEALTTNGFLTPGRSINDWEDYTGRLVAQRESNRERQRRFRNKNQRDTSVTSQQENAPVTVTSPLGNGATVPNQTVPTEPTEPVGDTPTPPVRAKSPKYSVEFEAFWTAYPEGHGSKKPAWDVWQRLRPKPELQQAILAGLERWKLSDRWSRGYIIHANRWLRDRGWEDPPPNSSSNGPPGESALARRRRELEREAHVA